MAALAAERDGRVLVVKFDNAPTHLIDRRVIAELTEVVRLIEDDRTLGALVLTGAAPGRFLTHYDIDEMVDGAEGVPVPLVPATAAAASRSAGVAARIPGGRRALRRTPLAGVVDLDATTGLFRRLERLDKVVLAAIGGPAIGAACELALACDLRYVADDVEAIGSLEIAMGFAPGAGGTQRQSRTIGPARALEAILDGRLLSAAEALAMGFAHRVVPADRLLHEAVETGHRLARRAPIAVAAVKRALYDGASRPLREGLALERSWFMAALSRPAARRALQRYVDELAETGRGAWEDPSSFEPWREGTALDLVTA